MTKIATSQRVLAAMRWSSIVLTVIALFFALRDGHILIGWCLGSYLGWLATAPFAAKAVYTAGWLEGRQAMVQSLNEAWTRGMSPEDWLHAEIERDCARLGVPVPKIDTDERGE